MAIVNGIDTNVLLRLLLRDDKDQAQSADRFVERACSAETPCLINRIVLVEAAWVLGTGCGYGREQVAVILENILRTDVLAVENAAEAWAALKDYRSSRADFADCLIGRGNRAFGRAETATFDRASAARDGFAAI